MEGTVGWGCCGGVGGLNGDNHQTAMISMNQKVILVVWGVMAGWATVTMAADSFHDEGERLTAAAEEVVSPVYGLEAEDADSSPPEIAEPSGRSGGGKGSPARTEGETKPKETKPKEVKSKETKPKEVKPKEVKPKEPKPKDPKPVTTRPKSPRVDPANEARGDGDPAEEQEGSESAPLGAGLESGPVRSVALPDSGPVDGGQVPVLSEGSAPLRMEPALSTVTGVALPQSGFPLVSTGDAVFGSGIQRYVVQGHETLLELALVNDLGYNEISLANPALDPWLPEAGDLVRLPMRWILPQVDTPGSAIIINLPEMRLYYRMRNRMVVTHPVGIGQEGLDTPVGKTSVIRKQASPTWYVPKSILDATPDHAKTVPPGPDNPLGTHALYLGLTGYLIHGTNQPFGVGRRVSHGCIRMYPDDIPHMFGLVPVGETVHLVDQPVKAGWEGEQLYLEVHPPLKEPADPVDYLGKLARGVIAKQVDGRSQGKVRIDWEVVEQAVVEMDGIPHWIGALEKPAAAVGAGWETSLGGSGVEP